MPVVELTENVFFTAGAEMELTPVKKERRKSPRLKGRKEAILVTPNGIHHISDISAGGLSFECSAEIFFPGQWTAEIIYAGTPIYLQDITVRLVQERIHDSDVFFQIPTKDVGVQFVDIDEESTSALNKLLALHRHPHNTFREAPSVTPEREQDA